MENLRIYSQIITQVHFPLSSFPQPSLSLPISHGPPASGPLSLTAGSQFSFSILQQMISDYLQNDFDSNKCDELSAEIMDLLYALLSFGFYCSFEHIYDITLPLIQVSLPLPLS
jgi:hypothetical protein